MLHTFSSTPPQKDLHRYAWELRARLEDHLVWPVAFPQAEVARQITLQHRGLLDACQQRLVHLLLVLGAVARHALLLALALVEEGLLAALLVRLLVPREVALAADLVDGAVVEVVERHGGLGCDDVAGVDAAEGHAVDLEGAGHEQDTLVENLEEDYALASEAAGEEDENFAGSEGCARLVGVEALASLSWGSLLAFVSAMSVTANAHIGVCSSNLPPLLPLHSTHLPGRRIILCRVVLESLVASGGDHSLLLAELLGLSLGRRHLGRL